jgi:hypothetical protein
MDVPKPPKSLGKHGRKFWLGVLADFEICEAHSLKLLEQAAGCCDRISASQEEIRLNGCFQTDRFGKRVLNPACALERDNRILLARLCRELQLDLDPPVETRIPGRY